MTEIKRVLFFVTIVAFMSGFASAGTFTWEGHYWVAP